MLSMLYPRPARSHTLCCRRRRRAPAPRPPATSLRVAFAVRSLKNSQRHLEEKLESANTALSFFSSTLTASQQAATGHGGTGHDGYTSTSSSGSGGSGSGHINKRRKKGSDGGAPSSDQQGVFMTLILNELHKQNLRMDNLERKQNVERKPSKGYSNGYSNGYSSSG